MVVDRGIRDGGGECVAVTAYVMVVDRGMEDHVWQSGVPLAGPTSTLASIRVAARSAGMSSLGRFAASKPQPILASEVRIIRTISARRHSHSDSLQQ